MGTLTARGLAIAACLHAAAASGFGQPAERAAARKLTVTLGPRGAEWRRAFDPFRDDTDTRWPATAGVYEPLLVYNRAARDVAFTFDLMRRFAALDRQGVWAFLADV